MRATLFLLLSAVLPLRAADWFVGGDLSATGRMEQLGATYRDRGGKPSDPIRAMASFGCNCVRLRLFVSPDGKGFTNNDLPYTLALAKRAKAANQSILLDFHYSDTWADPSNQAIPAAWPQADAAALAEKVESYTREALRAFAKENVFPELVQIGNEIENGMLWPVGMIWRTSDQPADWKTFSDLLKAAARGVRGGTPAGKHVRIILHTATGGIVGKTSYFHGRMRERGVDYDIAGLSYYPWWHGTLDQLRENTLSLARNSGKQVMVVEAGFRWWPDPNKKEPASGWPATPDGQAAFLRDVIRVVREIPDGKGIGVLWWHPDSIPAKGEHVWLGGSCALWKPDGTPLPALNEFRKP